MALVEKFSSDPKKFPSIKIHNNKIFIRLDSKPNDELSDVSVWIVWLPNSMVPNVLKAEHDATTAAHGGITKTLERIRRTCYWPRMSKEVRRYVLNCEICKTCKAPNQLMKPPLSKHFKVERPWQRVYIDLLGPYPRSSKGKKFVLILLDHFTKFILIKSLSSASSNLICDFLRDELFYTYGVPDVIHSDNGVQFKSHEYKLLLKDFAVKDSKTAFYSPQSNLSERVNRSIVCAIRSYIQKDIHVNWDKHLSAIASALRHSIHESVSNSPHFLLFGYHKINHGSDYELLREIDAVGEGEIEIALPQRISLMHSLVQEELIKAFEKRKKYYNLRSRYVEFSPGQTVFVRQFNLSDASNKFCSKFAPQFKKMIVNKKMSSVTYEMRDLAGKIVVWSYISR